MGKPGKLGDAMLFWGANQLVLQEFYNEKHVQQHSILHVTILKTWHGQKLH